MPRDDDETIATTSEVTGDRMSRLRTSEIEPRTVVALETSSPGIVIDVQPDGTLVVAVRGGRSVQRRPSMVREILAGPDDPHPERGPIIDDWLERPADWPNPWDDDDTLLALTRAMWTAAHAFMAEHGLTLREDVDININVLRPRVRVPSVLRLHRRDMGPLDPVL